MIRKVLGSNPDGLFSRSVYSVTIFLVTELYKLT